MRLFFALWPTMEEQMRFRDAARDLVPIVSGRWIARENLHLTLLFLPSVDEERTGPLFSLVDRSLLPNIFLRLDRLLFQPAGREGLLWLVPSGHSGLAHLVESLRARLRAMGCPLSFGRSFSPHITLARRAVLPCRPRSSRRQPVLLHRLEPPIDWAVRELALVSSETRPEGSRYTLLASWALPTPA
ncbi:RNA 2',3'-cyclic phosphodiesterase [Methylacidimicrobium sp. B4]|uniref:RNA 2',3'-cyclic phosphodiesterase n=1 Tax=Methylacidimicrobium sp. B4 TaxID=2796139 RepID=UPI001A8F364C|nr:RNA 2',3'-cyclic phosphodiesterase [Methylacidimicrobium sp. B4]QSR84111.1 RNA 2',3'-cyclic phosphodiesterase [Methylacidimicrobium sp. B4]